MASVPRETPASGTYRRRRPALRSRRSLLWALAWLAAIHLGLIAFLECKQPEFFDPKYGCRLVSLRERLAHSPGQPLCVVLGSSRAEQGFRPHLLPGSTSGAGPVVCNLARGGSSSLMHLLTLHRLLADGIRPRELLLEIFPPALVEDDAGVVIPKTTLRDLPVLSGYPVSWHTHGRLLRDRLLLVHQYRLGFLAELAPAWLLGRKPWSSLWNEQGGEWRRIPGGARPEERRRLIADARRRYFHKLQAFEVSPGPDQALRALLQLCREQHIRVVLFLMPESREFRSWYSAPALCRLSGYLAELQKGQGLTLIDAREWVEDDGFWDGHHLLRDRAAAFTHRLASQVMPELEGQGSFHY